MKDKIKVTIDYDKLNLDEITPEYVRAHVYDIIYEVLNKYAWKEILLNDFDNSLQDVDKLINNILNSLSIEEWLDGVTDNDSIKRIERLDE